MKKIIFILLLISNIVNAQTFPEHVGLVTDDASIFSITERNLLENKLRDYEKRTSIEIAIVTIKTLGEYDIESYANKLFKKWGIGKKGINNGLLLLISMKEHKFRVEVGYELEEYITDGFSKLTSENYAKPHFKNKEYYTGFNQVLDIFISKIGNETLKERKDYKAQLKLIEVKKSEDNKKTFLNILLFIGILIIIGFVIYHLIERKKRKQSLLDAIDHCKSVYLKNMGDIRYKLGIIIQEKFTDDSIYKLVQDIIIKSEGLKGYKELDKIESELGKNLNEIKKLTSIVFMNYDISKSILKFDKDYNKRVNDLKESSKKIVVSITNILKKYDKSIFNGINYEDMESYVETEISESKSNLEKSNLSLNNNEFSKAESLYIYSNLNLKNVQILIDSISKRISQLDNAINYNNDSIKNIDNIIKSTNDIVSNSIVSSYVKSKFNKTKKDIENFRKIDQSNKNPIEIYTLLVVLINALSDIKSEANREIIQHNYNIESDKRRLEESIRLNSYNSYNSSSSSSSSDSGFSFGGGDSGGGGSTTSWD
jgi:uncharacterized protein